MLHTEAARDDSPELAEYWRRSPTPFDAEETPDIVARVFGEVAVHAWNAPPVPLPDGDAIRDYLVGRQAPTTATDAAARGLPVPLRVTKRGALLVAR